MPMKLLIDYLANLVTAERMEVLQNVLDQRTRYLTVVLEDIFQPQNASAVLRTCDCFGVQDVHIIENENEYQINPDVVLGSSKWLSISNYNEQKNNTLEALQKLKNDGYRIVATSPHASDDSFEQFDITEQKTALVFGTELTGISDIVKQNADDFLKIPMYGFTESFNISVSAALLLQQLTMKLRKTEVNWQLEDKEKDKLLIDWLLKTIKYSDKVLRRFYEENPNFPSLNL
ncbi:MAG: RNA methyltransferase [Flavobacteriaceae bacterium]|nr:RNA methyltransferase [Flavobacteriaceae bacterium]